MDPRSLSALGLLNDLRHAAIDALSAKHKFPALLLLYSFVDICASMASSESDNRKRFEDYVNFYYHPGLSPITSYDLWAARSSLLHAFSPLGHHTAKENGATPIFYYAWPQVREQISEQLQEQGYTRFHLVDIDHIRAIAVTCFNAFWSRVERERDFERSFLQNAEHLLKDHDQLQLARWLVYMDNVAAAVSADRQTA